MSDRFMEHYQVDRQHDGVAKAQAFLAKTTLKIMLDNEDFKTMPEYIRKRVTESVERLEDIERMLEAIGKHSKHLTCSECGSPRSHLICAVRECEIPCPNECEKEIR